MATRAPSRDCRECLLLPSATWMPHSKGEDIYSWTILQGFPCDMLLTIPSVRMMPRSASPCCKIWHILPVPWGTSVQSRWIPRSSKAPSSMAKCQGRLKCSGTPMILTFFMRFRYTFKNRDSLRYLGGCFHGILYPLVQGKPFQGIFDQGLHGLCRGLGEFPFDAIGQNGIEGNGPMAQQFCESVNAGGFHFQIAQLHPIEGKGSQLGQVDPGWCQTKPSSLRAIKSRACHRNPSVHPLRSEGFGQFLV